MEFLRKQIKQSSTVQAKEHNRVKKGVGLVAGALLASTFVLSNSVVVVADENGGATAVEVRNDSSATNLVPVQPTPSAENTQAAASAGTQTGEMVTPVENTSLDNAVTEAKDTGVTIEETNKVTTNSFKEAETNLNEQESRVKDATATQKELDSVQANAEKEAKSAGVELQVSNEKVYKDQNKAALVDANTQAGQLAEATKAQNQVNESLPAAVKSSKDVGVSIVVEAGIKYEDATKALADLAQQVATLEIAKKTQDDLAQAIAAAVTEAKKSGVNVTLANPKTTAEIQSTISDIQSQLAKLAETVRVKQATADQIAHAETSAKASGVKVTKQAEMAYNSNDDALKDAKAQEDNLAKASQAQKTANQILADAKGNAAAHDTTVNITGTKELTANQAQAEAQKQAEKITATVNANNAAESKYQADMKAYEDEKNRLEKAYKEAQKNYNDNVARIETKYVADLKAYEDEKNRRDAEYQKALKSYNDRVSAIETKYAKDMKAYEDEKNRLDKAYNDELKSYNDRVSAIETKYAADLKAYEDEKNRLDKAYNDALKAYNDRVSAIESKYQFDLKSYEDEKNRLEKNYNDAVAAWEKEVAQIEAENQRNQNQHQADTSRINQENEAIKARNAAAESKYQTELATYNKAKADYDQKVREKENYISFSSTKTSLGNSNPETADNSKQTGVWTNLKTKTLTEGIEVVGEGTVESFSDIVSDNGQYKVVVYDKNSVLDNSHIIKKVHFINEPLGLEKDSANQSQWILPLNTWITIPKGVILADGTVHDLELKVELKDGEHLRTQDKLFLRKGNGSIIILDSAADTNLVAEGIVREYRVKDKNEKYLWSDVSLDIDGGQYQRLETDNSAVLSIGGGLRYDGKTISSDKFLGFSFGKNMLPKPSGWGDTSEGHSIIGGGLDDEKSLPDGAVTVVSYSTSYRVATYNVRGGVTTGMLVADFGNVINTEIPTFIIPKEPTPPTKPTPEPLKRVPSDLPDKKELPPKPEAPQVGERPKKEELPPAPEAPGYPVTPVKEELPKTPPTPQYPEAPSKEELPPTPETPAYPEVPVKEELPKTPPTPEYPEAPIKPTPKPVDIENIQVVEQSHNVNLVSDITPATIEAKTHDIQMVVPVHDVRVATTVNSVEVKQIPKNSKSVNNTEGGNINAELVAKGSVVEWVLSNETLKSGRDQVSEYKVTDALPKGFVLNLKETAAKSPDWTVDYTRSNHTITFTLKDDRLMDMNADVTVSARIPVIKVIGTVVNDGATYENTFVTDITMSETVIRDKDGKLVPQGKVEKYTKTSNKVEVYTPGSNYRTYNGSVVVRYWDDSATPNRIAPNQVDLEDAKIGTKYDTTDQKPAKIAYNGKTYELAERVGGSEQGEVTRGTTFVDYYYKEVTPEPGKGNVIVHYRDEDGNTISNDVEDTPLTQIGTDYTTTDNKPNKITSEDRVEYTIIPEKTQGEENGKVRGGTIEVTYVYKRITPKPETPTPNDNTIQPVKDIILNKDGQSVDGKSLLPNAEVSYTYKWDFDQYKGMKLTEEDKLKGFALIGDLQDKTVKIDFEKAKLTTIDGKEVKGLNLVTYNSLDEASEEHKALLKAAGITPEGDFYMWSPTDYVAFANEYVEIGTSIMVTIPVVAGDYTGTFNNKIWQIDMGNGYAGNVVENNIPKLEAIKEVIKSIGSNENNSNGLVEVGQKFPYVLNGAVINANIAGGLVEYKIYDDFDERYDEYNAEFYAFANQDIKLADGTIIRADDEITRYFTQNLVRDEAGKVVAVEYTVEPQFLASIDEKEGVFNPRIYMMVNRVAQAETVENTFETVINGYEVKSNTVKTHTPEPPKPVKDVISNKNGQSVDGKTLLPNSEVSYTYKWDLDQYKGITLAKSDKVKAFALVGDLKDATVQIDFTKAKLTTVDGKEVSGVQLVTYKSINEASDEHKALLSAAGISPEGDFYMWIPDNFEAFATAYVETGTSLLATIPVITGNYTGTFDNKIWQVDFGKGYVGNVVENNIPKLEAIKDVVKEIGSKDSVNNGTIEVGEKFPYVLDGPAINANVAGGLTEYKIRDDFDERYDQYDSEFYAFADQDIKLADGTIIKKDEEITRYFKQELIRDESGKVVAVEYTVDSQFLASIDEKEGIFDPRIYMMVTRIAHADNVENTYTVSINGYEITSNTVVTHTPKPEEPKTPETPVSEVPAKPAEKVLPNTGDSSADSAAVLAGTMLLGFGLLGMAAKKKAEGEE